MPFQYLETYFDYSLFSLLAGLDHLLYDHGFEAIPIQSRYEIGSIINHLQHNPGVNSKMETMMNYLNPDLPIEERVSDLLSRMSLEEKISQTRNDCPAIPRLGIPAYDFWSEALHGVARNGRATVFPQAIGMAASWDRDLVKRVASAIGDEGRAKYHEALRKNNGNMIYQGLTFWSPNVNIFRDPRWGRGQETWGEDPFLTGEMGSAFVQGLQGDDPRYLKAAACAKHYAVHSGPEKLRHTFDVDVSSQDLYATYLPAFREAGDGG